MSLEFFADIFRKCDLTELKTLKLWVPYNYRGLEAMAQDVKFPNLEMLILGCNDIAFPEDDDSDESFAAELLLCLPPLPAVSLNHTRSILPQFEVPRRESVMRRRLRAAQI